MVNNQKKVLLQVIDEQIQFYRSIATIPPAIQAIKSVNDVDTCARAPLQLAHCNVHINLFYKSRATAPVCRNIENACNKTEFVFYPEMRLKQERKRM